MSSKPYQKQGARKRRRRQKNRMPLFVAVGGFLVLIAALLLSRSGLSRNTGSVPVEVKGSASLKVDKSKVDLGNVKLDKPVTVEFELANVGDETLRFTDKPYVDVVQGCWPPEPVIGAMALKPGEKTTLSMTFMMHAGMDGQHDFRVHLPTNDPATADTTLQVLSNWVP